MQVRVDKSDFDAKKSLLKYFGRRLEPFSHSRLSDLSSISKAMISKSKISVFAIDWPIVKSCGYVSVFGSENFSRNPCECLYELEIWLRRLFSWVY